MQRHSNISHNLASDQTFTVENSRAEEALKVNSALNSASTMPEGFMPQPSVRGGEVDCASGGGNINNNNVLAESSIQAIGEQSIN